MPRKKKTKLPKAVKHRTPKVPEEQFDVRLAVPASRLGHLLVLLDGRYDIQGVRLIKEMAPGKNNTRGSFRQVVLEALQANKGSMPRQQLMEHTISHGFTKFTFHSAISKMERTGEVTIERIGRTNQVVHLKEH